MSKGDRIQNTLDAALICTIFGSVLAVPFYGITPLIVVVAGIVTAKVLLSD